MTSVRTQAHAVCLLYALSGVAGLAYETVWIRQFSISFGSTLLSFSTVIAVYLGGLAIGAAWGGRVSSRNGLRLYAAAELCIGIYALGIASLIGLTPAVLSPFYGENGGASVALVRALLSAAILLPATIAMGATLPLLASWFRAQGEYAPSLNRIYAANTIGGACGVLFTGLWLLPWFGYSHTVWIASALDIAVGSAAVWLSRSARPQARVEDAVRAERTKVGTVLPVIVLITGSVAMLDEVVWTRVAGLMFGPSAATITLVLAIVLSGLGAGAGLACLIRRRPNLWLAASQATAAFVSLCACAATAASPVWLANQLRAAGDSPERLRLLEAELLTLLLFPLMTASGMALPLALRSLKETGREGAAGSMYAVNTAGCIAGTLLAGWLLVPYIGTERTLYLGVVSNAAVVFALLPGRPQVRIAAMAAGGIALAGFAVPRWDMAALTAGAYKYAAYYSDSASAQLHAGNIEFLREGAAGTVTVRLVNGSRVLAIDGKVDATDSGGDLLTEKLLADIPLQLVPAAENVCVIGLASGVTAGTALRPGIHRMDLVEVSREVVQASHLFDAVNGKPLADRRTDLIANDGRNHLALTSRRYDAILSEPSNPWIAGMNSMFTRDFFRIARHTLKPNGVLAQWFHLYNMPAKDLRSLLRAFMDVFPSTILWQLNDGDVLLTGFNGVAPNIRLSTPFLASMYVMRDADLDRFAAGAPPNTDDRPLLEFHGQQNLQLQTSESNAEALDRFPRQVPPPPEIQAAVASMMPEDWAERGKLLEAAESYRLAFASYRKSSGVAAIAGMLRCARSPGEHAIAGSMESQTRAALAAVRGGDSTQAEMIFLALQQAFPAAPEPLFNYGLFCLERSRTSDAIKSFHHAISLQSDYLPACEALAEVSLRSGDVAGAEAWSRRILQIDPAHAAARQTLASLEKQRSAQVKK